MIAKDVPQSTREAPTPLQPSANAGTAESNDRWAKLSHEDPLVRALTETTRRAGDLGLNFFRTGEHTSAAVTYKTGGSPVTEADRAVNDYLAQHLRKALPQAAWLSEESIDAEDRLAQDLVLVVDPIDGTRGFIEGLPSWAVAVALVLRARPIIGIIHAPALSQTFVGVRNCGARLNDVEIHVSQHLTLDGEAKVAGPQPLARKLQKAGLSFELLPKIPSLALRIAYVASGQLEAALVSANSHDWDIAAADLILAEAGGRLETDARDVPLYNRPDTSHGILFAGPIPIVAQIHEALSRA